MTYKTVVTYSKTKFFFCIFTHCTYCFSKVNCFLVIINNKIQKKKFIFVFFVLKLFHRACNYIVLWCFVQIVSKLGILMTTLREGRVNAALTIQIYNQVFRFINAWTFNRLITADLSYFNRTWGARLKSRIGRLQAWAERQGLEVSADCQLALMAQAADLLHVSH